MPRRDPSAPTEPFDQIAATKYFTDREAYLRAFDRFVEAPAGTGLRVLNFFGVGGIGKTALINALRDRLSSAEPPVPHAWFNLQNVKDPTQAYLQVLLG